MKHFGVKIILLLAIAGFKCSSQTSNPMIYPDARASDVINTYHEKEVADPYQWMEELNIPELEKWMTAQDELYDSYLSKNEGLVNTFRSELSEQFEKDMTYAPVQSGDKMFLPVTPGGASAGQLYELNPSTGEKKLLFDLEQLKTDTKTYSTIGYSPQGKYVTIGESLNKSRYQRILFYDVSNNAMHADTVSGYYGGRSFISWDQNADGFYYSKYEVPTDPQAQLPRAQFMYHKMGTSQKEDLIVFENKEEAGWIFSGSTTNDGQQIILHITDPAMPGNMVYVKDLRNPSEPFFRLVDDFENLYTFLYKEKDQLFFQTTFNAPNHQVVAIDVKEFKSEKWRTIIPESDQVISGSFLVGNKLALRSNNVTKMVFNVHDRDGRLAFSLEPDGSAMFFSQTDRKSTKGYMFVASILSPVSVFEIDLQSGSQKLYSQVKLSVDPSDYTFEHSSYTSKDGTEVPIQLVYKKGLEKDGSAPVFLYGYGAFNWSAYPWQNYLLPWIKRGGIYAIPNIRGGGVNGADWYAAGSRSNKRKTIEDYISAAEWLIESNYSKKGMIVANGGSASGLLPAIATNERPDLYGACLIDYPVLDMLRYHQFGSANWTSEFGTSNDQADFDLLQSYSPYHNIRKNSCYPPTLVQVGELDNTTTPMHGYKYTAALQNALKSTCNNPVILKISRGAGHSLGATRKDRIQTEAEQMAFLFNVLRLDAQ